jgi:hypothetical protein
LSLSILQTKYKLENMELEALGNEEMTRAVEFGRPVNIFAYAAMAMRMSVYWTSVMFVSISFIVLMMISLAWLVFYYIQRFRYLHAKDRLSRELTSAAEKALAKIPLRNIKNSDREVTDAECCAVCIEAYKATDVVRLLPCRHEFHKVCVDPWLLTHRTCPMCKMDILKHYGYVFTGSQESVVNMELDIPIISGLRPNLRPHRNHSTVLSAPNSPPAVLSAGQRIGDLAVSTSQDMGPSSSSRRYYWSWPRSFAANAARNQPRPSNATAVDRSLSVTTTETEVGCQEAEAVGTQVEVEECDTASRTCIVETYCSV